MALTRAQIIMTTALALCIDRPIPHDMPNVQKKEEEEEEDESYS